MKLSSAKINVCTVRTLRPMCFYVGTMAENQNFNFFIKNIETFQNVQKVLPANNLPFSHSIFAWMDYHECCDNMEM